MLLKGFRNGDHHHTLFNSPSGVVLFSQNITLQIIKSHTKTILLTNSTDECRFVNRNNYSLCEERNTSNVIINDFSLIKEVLMLSVSEIKEFEANTTKKRGENLFVADKNNHCIRQIDFISRKSTTFAGKCGTMGFVDGEENIALFNKPDKISVDVLGNLFVYDEGNKAFRIVFPSGST